MANLDTAAKRISGAEVMETGANMMPFADGTIGQGDRQHLAVLYSGILAAGASIVRKLHHPSQSFHPMEAQMGRVR